MPRWVASAATAKGMNTEPRYPRANSRRRTVRVLSSVTEAKPSALAEASKGASEAESMATSLGGTTPGELWP
jgi:hypothetical protein